MDPAGRFESTALMSTDVTLLPITIIEEFVKRWSIEVTFREVREHLGVETQRQWSNKAIARETPGLFALYSIVILIGLNLENIPIRTAAWYLKNKSHFLTFWSKLGESYGEKRISLRSSKIGTLQKFLAKNRWLRY